jgi:hypothetical protein
LTGPGFVGTHGRRQLQLSSGLLCLVFLALWYFLAEQGSGWSAIFEAIWFPVLALGSLPFVYDSLRGRTAGDDKAVFAQELSDLLDLGSPLLDALKFLEQQYQQSPRTRLSRLTSVLGTLVEGVSAGGRLNAVMAMTNYFPPLWSEILMEAPEDRLPDTLRALAESEELNVRIPVADLNYLVVNLVMALGIFKFLVTYITPTFVELSKGAEVELVYLDLFRTLAPVACVLLVLGIFAAAVYWRKSFRHPGPSFLGFLDGLARTRRLLLSVTIARAAVTAGVSGQQLVDSALMACLPKGKENVRAGQYATLADLYQQEPGLQDPSLAWVMSQAYEHENLAEALEVADRALLTTYLADEQRSRWVVMVFFLGLFGGMVALMGLAMYGSVIDLYGAAAPEVFLP